MTLKPFVLSLEILFFPLLIMVISMSGRQKKSMFVIKNSSFSNLAGARWNGFGVQEPVVVVVKNLGVKIFVFDINQFDQTLN